MNARTLTLSTASLLVAMISAFATANYSYDGSDEYDNTLAGISPDGEFAVTAHGGGEFGYDKFHLYLTDVKSAKNIGPLKEIHEVLDTAADAFAAKWSSDSREVTIV